MTEFDTVLAEILDGRHDTQLAELVQALNARFEADTVDAHWVCIIDGDGDKERFTIRDLTYRAIRLFEKATKRNLNTLDLTGLSGTDTAALVAAHWAASDPERDGAYQRAVDRVDGLAGDAIVFDVEVDRHPGPFDD